MNKCLDGMSPLPVLRVATSELPNDPLLLPWLLETQDTLTSGLLPSLPSSPHLPPRTMAHGAEWRKTVLTDPPLRPFSTPV